MVCLGIEPGAAGWKARTNPLSYGGTPILQLLVRSLAGHAVKLYGIIFNVFVYFRPCHITTQI